MLTLIRQAQDGDQGSLEHLVRDHGAQVRRLAGRLFMPGAEKEDLHQEGMAGLVHAIRTYNPERGSEFSNYATMCIRNSLHGAVRKTTRKKRMVLSRAEPLPDDLTPQQPSDPARQVEARMLLGELMSRLRRELSGLEYQALVQRMEGYTLEEIGSSRQVSSKQVENALFRARRKARGLLSQMAPSHPLLRAS